MSDNPYQDVPVRKSKVIDLDAVMSNVKDGMTVAIGGFINSSHPMIIVREIIRRGLKDLTIVGAASSGLEIDLLIAAGVDYKPYIKLVSERASSQQVVAERKAEMARPKD